jgi:hypothetical protein
MISPAFDHLVLRAFQHFTMTRRGIAAVERAIYRKIRPRPRTRLQDGDLKGEATKSHWTLLAVNYTDWSYQQTLIPAKNECPR